MSEEIKLKLNNAEVLAFIAARQINPELLEELAASVMTFERQYAAEINQAVASSTSLEEESMFIDTYEQRGYRVDVLYFKEADPKDATAWRTKSWFLRKNERGALDMICEITPADAASLAEEQPNN